MLRRFFSKARTTALRQAFRPRVEGLESRWTPATASFSNLTKTLTVTVTATDTGLALTQDDTLPLGYISATDNAGIFFNDADDALVDRFVKNIVVKIPAAATTAIDIDFTGIAISGNLTVTAATTFGVDLGVSDCIIGTLKVISSVADGNTVNVLNSTLKGGFTASLNAAPSGNSVLLSVVNVGTNVNVIGKAGADTINFSSVFVAGKAAFNLGAGANTMNLGGLVDIHKTLNYIGADGVDTIQPDGGGIILVGGNSAFNLGNGNNFVDFTFGARFSRNLSFVGGSDGGTIILGPDVVINGNAAFNLASSTTTQSVDIVGTEIAGNLSIIGGTGRDDVAIQEAIVRGTTTIKLRAGNDDLDHQRFGLPRRCALRRLGRRGLFPDRE